MSEAPRPVALDVGPTTSWIAGCCLAAFCLGFAAVSLFELFVYDIPEATTWWDMDALTGALAAWTTLLVQIASRLRFDDDGIHRRSLWRRRHWPWSNVDDLAARPPRVRMVREVLSFRVNGAWRSTPWGINSHPGGARYLLSQVEPIAAENGVDAATPGAAGRRSEEAAR